MKKKWKERVVYIFLIIGGALLNFIYLFHKLFPTKDRISIVSRQASRPYEDITMLASELKKLSPGTDVVVSCRASGGGIWKKTAYLFHVLTRQQHLFATSRVVILDGYCVSASMLRHKKSLKIVQMWHAMGAFKKFGLVALDEEEGRNGMVAKGMRMHKNYDVIFVSSEICKEKMAPAYGCSTDIMEVMPLPRTDVLLDPQLIAANRKRIYEKYPELKEKKVILYTPTFRKTRKVSVYTESLINAVDFKTTSLIVNLHPHDAECIEAESVIIDPDFSSLEMLSVSDYVITDYSAFIFEAAVAGKPVFRFVPDHSEYDYSRGFLIDVDKEMPFFWSSSAEDIIRAIDENNYDPEEIKKFAEKYVRVGRNNTRRMAEFILDLAEK